MADTIGSIDGPTHLAAVQRIAELEAENQRLRKALQDIIDDEIISEPLQMKRGVSEIIAVARKAMKDA